MFTPTLRRSALVVRLVPAVLAAALVGCGGPIDPPVPPGPAPELLSSVPANGAAAVPVSTSMSFVFSRAMAAASLSVSISPAVTMGSPTWDEDGTEVRYPALALTPGTAYTVTVAAEAADGVALGAPQTISFTTAAQIDTTAPTLASSSPGDGATNVALAASLTLTFSEPMAEESVQLALEPDVELGAGTWSVGGTVLTVSPAQPLAATTSYVLTVQGADLAGNPLADTQVAFTTGAAPDSTPPTVASTAPAASANGVPTTAAISLSFSEAMNRASVDAAFSISPAVAGSALWDDSGTLRSFQPTAPLAAGTQYTVTLGVGAQDLSGNALAAPFSFSFTTANAPDTTKPTVVSTTPEGGAMGVARTTSISVTFSEPMDKASVQVAFAVTNPPGANVGVFSWNAAGTQMTFAPTTPYAYGTAVSWRVSTDAKDLAGNTMLNSLFRAFIVVKSTTLVVDATAALDGYLTSANGVSVAAGQLLVGDNASNVAYRSFLSFDLSAVPGNSLRIVSARVNTFLASAQGEPAGTLGGAVRLQRVNYGTSLTTDAWDTPTGTAMGDDLSTFTSKTPGWRSSFVTAGVNEGLIGRAQRVQFRLRMPNLTSANGQADLFTFYSGNSSATDCPRTLASGSSCKPYLVVTYEHP